MTNKKQSHQLLHGADSGGEVVVTARIGWTDESGLQHEPLTLTSHLSLQPGVLAHIAQVGGLVETRHKVRGLPRSGVDGGRSRDVFNRC